MDLQLDETTSADSCDSKTAATSELKLGDMSSDQEPETKKLKEEDTQPRISELKRKTDDFKDSFLAILTGLQGSIDGYNIGEQEQAKTSAETAVNHLLETAKAFDTHLNRQQIAFIAKRPDVAINEEMTQLQREIFNKKRALEKHEALINSKIQILAKLKNELHSNAANNEQMSSSQSGS